MRYLSHVDEYLTLKYKYKYKYYISATDPIHHLTYDMVHECLYSCCYSDTLGWWL